MVVLQLQSLSFGLFEKPGDAPMISGRLTKMTTGVVVRPTGIRLDCAVEEARVEQAVSGCAVGVPLVRTCASNSSVFR